MYSDRQYRMIMGWWNLTCFLLSLIRYACFCSQNSFMKCVKFELELKISVKSDDNCSFPSPFISCGCTACSILHIPRPTTFLVNYSSVTFWICLVSANLLVLDSFCNSSILICIVSSLLSILFGTGFALNSYPNILTLPMCSEFKLSKLGVEK